MAIDEVDYLVIGAGATAMAFVDTLLTHSEKGVLIVDRRDHPGGHWNDAYSFVRLHQPSAFYGVGSRSLGENKIEDQGLNAGHQELASKPEIIDHYGQVMRQRFLASGRVRWLPKYEYTAGVQGEHLLSNLIAGDISQILVKNSVVDTTLSNIRTPASRAPSYVISNDVAHIPVGGLVRLSRPYEKYVVIGAGKTGMDTCLWLLQHGIDAARVRWVMPHDPWVIDRSHFKSAPSVARFELQQLEAVIKSQTLDDFLRHMENADVLSRIYQDTLPSSFRCAVVSDGEINLLRRITDVVRLGHVKAIHKDILQLDGGNVPTAFDTLYIDCSATGTGQTPDCPIFCSGRIFPQPVRTCQPVFSAALIAFVESRFENDAVKNALCTPVPFPKWPIDILRMSIPSLANAMAWAQYPELAEWVDSTRLDRLTALRTHDAIETQELQAIASRMLTIISDAKMRLPQLLKAYRLEA